MYCDACGAKLTEGQSFCRACGKPAGGVPMMPAQSRIAGHVRLLGILWLASSAMHLIPGMVLMFISHARFMRFPPDVAFVPHLMGFMGFVFSVASIAGFFAGIGLLQRAPWARMLAIVLGALALLNLPFGTALGIYTLWVLLPAQAEDEYRRLSLAA